MQLKWNNYSQFTYYQNIKNKYSQLSHHKNMLLFNDEQGKMPFHRWIKRGI